MAKILIAEDDEFLREIISEHLTAQGHKVFTAPNGKVAKDIVLAGGFDLVISDVQMPFLNGVELLHWLREKSQMPFILMTGFSNLLETQEAVELGAQGFLSKPFSNQDLTTLVSDLLKPQAELTASEPAPADEVYCKVSIEEFVARPQIEFDIYVRLASARYLKVAYKGETLDVARLRNYQSKGMTHLHIKKEDFDKLVSFNLQVTKVLQGTKAVTAEKKARFIKYTAESIMERCYISDMDTEAFEDAKDFVNVAMNTLTDSPQMLDLLNTLNEHSDFLYAHCLGVSVYSVMIAKQLNYNSSATYFKLAMAGLLHDIGKKEIERDLLLKPRALMNAHERKTYESHAQRGREIMESIPGTPTDVVQIIYEHHEDDIEQGYPCQTPHLKLHPLSRVIYLADQFVTRAQKTPVNEGMSAQGAVAHIEKFDMDRVNKDLFKALKAMLGQKKAA